MRALCFTEKGLELREAEPPRPLENEAAIAALTGGEVRVGPLIDAVVPLRDGVAAFAKAQEPDCLKVLLDMSI